MAEPKPLPQSLCTGCDQICIGPYNPDEECFGRMSTEERTAFFSFWAVEHGGTYVPIDPLKSDNLAADGSD